VVREPGGSPNGRLRRAREERSWTQTDVARAIGTTKLTVSRWELGVQQPVPFFRGKLCALFETTPERLGLIPEPGSPVLRELPRPPADFTGRLAELARLRELLDPAAPGPALVCAMDGMGGIGKSALALVAAHQLAGAFPDGQLYVNLQGATAGLPPLEPVEALGRMLRSLGLDPAAVPGGVEEAGARFRSVVAGRRLLLVLDDARSADQVRPLLPGTASSAVLITSRRVLATLEGVHTLHLDVLSRDQALELLGRIAGPERVAADPEAAEEVVGWCGRLPLAIRIAGARLAARPEWPVRDLAGELADAARRLETLRAGELAVRASFEVSLQALEQSADLGDTAAAAAFGPLSLLEVPDLAVATAARLLDRPEPAVRGLLERLVDAQLLEAPRAGRCRFHDLARLYAREHAARLQPTTDHAAALARAIGFFVATAWAAATHLQPGAWRLATADPRWTGGGLELADAGAALGWLDAERANLLAAAAQAAQDALGTAPALPAALAGQLARGIYDFLAVRSHWRDLAQLNELALRVARRTGDASGQAIALNDLGIARGRLGDYAASVACLRESLALFGLLDDRIGQATSLAGLSLGELWRGRYAEAIDGQRRALAIFRELGDRLDQAVSLSNLAAIHGRLGQYADATACLNESFAISRELGDRLGEATALTNLGAVARELGRYEEAVARLRDAIVIFEEFGHRGRANGLHDLGAVYRLMGRHEEAIAALRQSLAIFQELDDRRGQAMVLRDLGDVLQALGRARLSREAWLEGLAAGEALQIPEADEIRARLEVSSAARSPSGSAG
jgi:tetratricopeptide (TPR) repeat protein/transcriptional regulator with XRE-family HTH domain